MFRNICVLLSVYFSKNFKSKLSLLKQHFESFSLERTCPNSMCYMYTFIFLVSSALSQVCHFKLLISCVYIDFLSAMLYQVNDHNTYCLEDTVLYSCSDDLVGLIIVDISRNSETEFTASYSYLSTTEPFTDNIQTSLIRIEIVFKNQTYISSIITITNVMNLDSYFLTCNEETLSLNNSLTSYSEGNYTEKEKQYILRIVFY